MSATIGVAIGRECVRAVAVKAGAVVWAAESAIESFDQLTDSLAELLSGVPSRRLRRSRVVLAIGPASSQTRVLGGLPPLKDMAALANVVREGARSFFLKNGVPLVTGDVQVIEPGRVLAAAFDQPVIAAAVAGCRAARFRVHAVVPALAVLGAGLDGERILWSDGPVQADVTLQDGSITAVRRIPFSRADTGTTPRAREPLAKFGDASWRFADAYGAACRGAGAPLGFRPGHSGALSGGVSRGRLAAAAVAAAFSGATALVVPTFIANRVAQSATAKLAELAEARSAAVVAETQLLRFSKALGEVAVFDASRRSVTHLLADVTRALPDGNALVSFRLDSAGGTVVAVAPRAAGVVAALEGVPGIAAPQIIGPVTRERVGDREVERITVRFEVVDDARPEADSAEKSKSGRDNQS